MTAPELKPCPFCGGEAHLRDDVSHSTAYFIGCATEECFGEIHWGQSEAEVIASWNTRADLIPATPLAADRDAQKARADTAEAERDRFEAALGRACLVGGTTYLVGRAEAAEAALAVEKAKVARLVEALEPSGETKAAYMGEIKDPETKRMVSWTAIKMVMAMISARAAIAEVQE